MNKKWLVCLLLAVVVLMSEGRAYSRGERTDDKTLSPYFFIEKGDPATERFPLKETNVAVTINGVIADVFVTQKYANDGKDPINARYVFPASTRASVHGMKMTIGSQVVTAKIKEREKAKADFNKAKSEGKSASLLEQKRPNVFTMNIANIMPKDEVLIELHYTELLVPTEGTYEFVYPTVVGPRYSNQQEATAPDSDRWVKSPYLKEGKVPPTQFHIGVSFSTGIPLQEILSPSHAVDVQWKDRSIARVSLAKPDDFGGNRDFILRYRLAGKGIESGLMLYEGEKENFFLLMVEPPERVKPAEILPREYIFVLDVSGSMNGFPLDTAKTLIKDLIGNLRENDRFNLVLFAGTSCIMAGSSVPATKENINRAMEVIAQQKGGGGTELAAALRRALALPGKEGVSRSVIIITDGFINAERDVFSLICNNLDTTNVFSFGIGSGVNRYLIEGMAKAGLGESFVVAKPEEAARVAGQFRSYVQSPLLTNTRVAFRSFETYDVEPPALPDLFARRPLILFGKWRGRPAGEIEISGTTAGGNYSRTFRVAETKPLRLNSPLRYLWARARIARLSDYNFHRENPETRNEITELGLAYSILTPYTSFIAVLETIRNPEKEAKDTDQPLPLPLGVSNLAVGGCSAVPEPEMVLLVVAIASIVLFMGIRRYRLKGPSQRAAAKD